jgi:dUTP pyrophosphatase
MSRKFEIAKGWEDKGINLPTRQTTHAAGYDFEAAEDVTLVPIWRSVINGMTIKPQLVATGIKAQMEPDEALFMYNRSGNPIKKLIMLANGVGVVDSDYYGNESNDGAIMFQFWNFGIKPIHIAKGERIGQGVFKKFLLVDDDTTPKKKRKGGHGSTGSTDS